MFKCEQQTKNKQVIVCNTVANWDIMGRVVTQACGRAFLNTRSSLF